MNHVNFNDCLPAYLFKPGPDNPGVPPAVLNSPVFVWRDCVVEKSRERPGGVCNDDVVFGIRDGSKFLPFPLMRLFIESDEVGASRGLKGFKVWIVYAKGYMIAHAMPVWPKHVETVFLFVVRPDAPLGISVQMLVRREGKAVKNDIVARMANFIFSSLCWFIREASLPSSFIASVSPDMKGKPVEWVKARTHYVILHKAHPANSKQVTAGATVTRSTESIKRQAHTRRAHARILRSSRYKDKRGQTIHVKATWVGPSEWKEASSIYRMVPRKQTFR